MSEVKRYTDAMMRGDDMACGDIEQQHGVYGLPPDLVTVVLAGVDAIAERDAALAELAALKGGQEAVAEVKQREPFEDGSNNPSKLLQWTLPNCEDDLPVGAKLYLAQPAQASAWVPEGWKLVPVEPTEAMMLNDSGCQHHVWDDKGCAARRVRFGVWAKMLAAAPTPGASDGGGELRSARLFRAE